MAGVDHTTAAVAERERFAFTKTQVGQALAFFLTQPGVSGAVLLCTCNRTELYLSVRTGAQIDPAALLAQAARFPVQPVGLIQARAGNEAVRHLMKVTCGLCSALRGDDQILTQVRKALEQARAAGATDAALETLFRLSVTAAKKVKNQVQLRAVPVSAAAAAVEKLAEQLGHLSGHRALVIGNGEMGRMAAQLLVRAGCVVTVTLRSYHHGENIIPYGCQTVSYDERLHAAAEADILLSATASPHFTLTRAMLESLPPAARQCVDLAVPRDIDPDAAKLPGLSYWNIDMLDGIDTSVPAEQMHQILDICNTYLQQFSEWSDGRILRETTDALTRNIHARIHAELEAGAGSEDEIAYAVRRTVESILFPLKGSCDPEDLRLLRQTVAANRPRVR